MLKRQIDKLAAYVAAWRESHVGSPAFFYVTAVMIGIFAGASAAALKSGITYVMHLVLDNFNIHAGNWGFLLLPVIGIFIAALITRYVARRPLDHATERIADDLKDNDSELSPRVILGSIAACSFTLGMGGSAGAESPIAYAGAAVGSNIGRVLKLPQATMARLLGCGAAAGIAGIYMAPIGGVMFALEVLQMRQNLQTVVALTFSSLVAALTCYILMGCHTDVSFVPEMRFDIHLIPYVLLCGILCGIYSLYYNKILSLGRRRLNKIGNTWMRALSGGLMMAALLFLFPSLYGEGYHTLNKLMDNDALYIISYSPLYFLGKHFWVLMLMFVALLLVKPFATTATNDSGGVGGDFTPTFFCGGVLGFMFASALNHYLHLHLPLALFVFFGMAAVMSGAQRAPLMAIFIAAEMTGLYGFILPLTIVAVASFVTTVLINRKQMPLLLKRNFDFDQGLPDAPNPMLPTPTTPSAPTTPTTTPTPTATTTTTSPAPTPTTPPAPTQHPQS